MLGLEVFAGFTLGLWGCRGWADGGDSDIKFWY